MANFFVPKLELFTFFIDYMSVMSPHDGTNFARSKYAGVPTSACGVLKSGSPPIRSRFTLFLPQQGFKKNNIKFTAVQLASST